MLALPGLAWAQQPPPAPPAPQQQPSQWQQLPRMQLERQYAGPLQDTLIQRWRDPVDGTTCYLYVPVSVQHSSTMDGSGLEGQSLAVRETVNVLWKLWASMIRLRRPSCV